MYTTLFTKKNNPNSVDNVIDKQIQKETGKNALVDVLIYEIQNLYYLTIGDLANAYEYAQKCFTCHGHPFCEYLGYALCTKVHIAGGRLDEAADCIAKAEAISKTAAQRQGITLLKNKLSRAQNAYNAGAQA